MNKPNYKAAISGAASQGKSTLMKELTLSSALAEYNFSFLTGVARGVGKYLPINEGGTFITQFMIMSKHVESCLQPGRRLTDRCALDVISYTNHHWEESDISDEEMNVLTKAFEFCLGRLDRIFYIVPELPVEHDGERSTEKRFFDGSLDGFNFFLKCIKDNPEAKDKIVEIRGTVKERLAIIENTIKQDLEAG